MRVIENNAGIPQPSAMVMSASKRSRVLVFPAGSEIGLEVNRSIGYLKEIELFAANSSDDHSSFEFSGPVYHLPYIDHEDFYNELDELLTQLSIQYIFPTMDSVLLDLSKNQENIRAEVIGSKYPTNEIVCSKKKTYEKLSSKLRCPAVYRKEDLEDNLLPLFIKPDYGYGSRGTKIIKKLEEIGPEIIQDDNMLVMEYLPGKEFTVDCFSDFNRNLLYCSPRERQRIQRGISVRSQRIESENYDFREMAEIINSELEINGAWFFQLKTSVDGELCLMEIATRIGGSSGINHLFGVNLALLSVLNQSKEKLRIIENNIPVIYDRALNSRAKMDFIFNEVFVDFDDCLFSEKGGINPALLYFITDCRNKGKKISLITRHNGDINSKLIDLGLNNFFSQVIHIRDGKKKTDFIDNLDCILIDDSFSERLDANKHGIPAFGPEVVNFLL